MKFLFLLAAFCCVAASTEVFVQKFYTGKVCGESNIDVIVSTNIQLGCNNGIKYSLSGNELSRSTYSTADCTGAAGMSGKYADLDKCTSPAIPNSYKYIKMSEVEFNTYLKGSQNLVQTQYQESDTCTGKSTVRITPYAVKGKCKDGFSSSSKVSWDKTNKVTETFAETECGGTSTSTEEKLDICVNGTHPWGKRSHRLTVNPKLTMSSAMRSSSLQGAMILGIIFIASCLY